MNFIDDAHITDFTPNQLGDPGKAFQEWVVNGIDSLTRGQKADIVTESLIFAEVVEDPAKMRELTKTYNAQLNEYFETVDYAKIVGNTSDELITPVKDNFVAQVKAKAPIFFAGLGVGIISSALVNVYISKKKGGNK